jgi:protein-tyrosine phosphatase
VGLFEGPGKKVNGVFMIGRVSRVLFICTGNICRSPFAKGLFDRLVSERGLVGVEADSAGLLALPDNAATAMAQRVAAEHHVDLSAHRAKSVSHGLLTWCDLALVMEKSHEQDLLSSFPKATGKVLLLRYFARRGSRTRGIADPYGLQYEAYRFCFLDIQEAISGLLAYLSASSTAFEPVAVRCYEGYQSCESPRSFTWHGQTYQIEEIVDRWYEGQQEATARVSDYFKIRAHNGSIYLLRYDREFGSWGVMVG